MGVRPCRAATYEYARGMTIRVGIALFDQFDLIDAGGPYEVFLTASRLEERDGKPPAYEVQLISAQGHDVAAYGGMTLTGLASAHDVGALDVLVVPGLIDLDHALNDARVLTLVAELARSSELVTSVCTGAFLLAEVGILEGRPATTHWEDVDVLERSGKVGSTTSRHRWVDDGQVVTSGGLTSGLHMALHVVARTHSLGLAERTARQLDLVWDPEGPR